VIVHSPPTTELPPPPAFMYPFLDSSITPPNHTELTDPSAIYLLSIASLPGRYHASTLWVTPALSQRTNPLTKPTRHTT
jgi:hypothetical protein